MARVLHAVQGKAEGSGFKGIARVMTTDSHRSQFGKVIAVESWSSVTRAVSQRDVIAALKAQGVWPTSSDGTHKHSSQWREVAQYEYRDEHGRVLYCVRRYEPKDFRQFHPDGRGGWSAGTQGVKRVLYRLPELVSAIQDGQPVFIVEGEKDCDTLCKLGLVTTTNVGGAGKWRKEYTEYFRDAEVIILPDNDDAGWTHADKVARSVSCVARSVRVVKLPNLPTKGDVSDWFRGGGTLDALRDLVEAASVWSGKEADDGAGGECVVRDPGAPWDSTPVPDGFELCDEGVFRRNGTQRTKIAGHYGLWPRRGMRTLVSSGLLFDGAISTVTCRSLALCATTCCRTTVANCSLCYRRSDCTSSPASRNRCVSIYLDFWTSHCHRCVRLPRLAGWSTQWQIGFVLPHETLGAGDNEHVVLPA